MRNPTSLLAVAALAAAPTATAQDAQILGRWRTQDQGGVVEIHPCGPALCGRLVDAAPLRANPDQRDVRNPDPTLRNRRLHGLVVLRAFTGGPTRWSGGPLYDPDSGQGARRGTLTLTGPDTLAVRGCIAPLLCRTQIWRRAR